MADRIIRVTSLTTIGSGMPAWFFDGPSVDCLCGCGKAIDRIADMLLRPIRDPGDDAIDWISHRAPRSVDLKQDQLTRARAQLQEVMS